MVATPAQSLDSLGYVVLPGVLSVEEATAAWRGCVEALGEAGSQARTGDKTAAGTPRLVELAERLPAVAELARRTPLVDMAAHVLGETVELSALTYRAPQPGFGASGCMSTLASRLAPGGGPA